MGSANSVVAVHGPLQTSSQCYTIDSSNEGDSRLFNCDKRKTLRNVNDYLDDRHEPTFFASRKNKCPFMQSSINCDLSSIFLIISMSAPAMKESGFDDMKTTALTLLLLIIFSLNIFSASACSP